MKKRNVVIVLSVVVVAGLWFLFRPERLFINKTVNEGLPATATAAAAVNPAMPAALIAGQFHNGSHDRGSIKGNEGDQNYDLPANADLSKDRAVTIWCARFNVNFGTAPLEQSSMTSERQMTPASAPATVLAGQFHKGAHDTSGMATIYQLGDGKRILRLTNFKTSNGPDVHVYLVAANDATDNDTVKKAGFLDLGSIKGNEGDQNYDLPSNADLSKDHAVMIWCARFNVNFGTAPLAQQMMQR